MAYATAHATFEKPDSREDSARIYVGQCSQISLRLLACLRVSDAMSVSGQREGRVYMFVCREARAASGVRGVGACQMESAGPTARLAIV